MASQLTAVHCYLCTFMYRNSKLLQSVFTALSDSEDEIQLFH